MAQATWILLLNIFVNVFVQVQSNFPDFFDDDDLKDLGFKHHKSNYKYGPTTGHYPGLTNSYYQLAPQVGMPYYEQNRHELRPGDISPHLSTDLAAHQLTYLAAKSSTDIPFGHGRSPMDSDEKPLPSLDDQPFPKPDGNPWGGDDFQDLNDLPNRLTKTNKWDEFKALLAAEKEQQHGKVMKNWEDNAHQWAAYSRHLLEREENEKQKQIARMNTPLPPPVNPAIGFEGYWADDQLTQPEAAPEEGPDMFQFVNNMKGPMEHNLSPFPPFKGNNPDSLSGYNSSPLRSGLNRPKPKQEYHVPGMSLGQNDYALPNLNEQRVPGPGAERDFPNGYHPFGDNIAQDDSPAAPGPLGYGMNPGIESGLPEGKMLTLSGASQLPGMGRGPSGGRMNPRIDSGGEMRPGMRPGGENKFWGKSTAFRGGEGYEYPSSMDGVPEPRSGPVDYPEVHKPGLRMGGMPGGFQNRPGPGSERDYPNGYHPSMGGENMERGFKAGPGSTRGGRPGPMGGVGPGPMGGGDPGLMGGGGPGLMGGGGLGPMGGYGHGSMGGGGPGLMGGGGLGPMGGNGQGPMGGNGQGPMGGGGQESMGLFGPKPRGYDKGKTDVGGPGAFMVRGTPGSVGGGGAPSLMQGRPPGQIKPGTRPPSGEEVGAAMHAISYTRDNQDPNINQEKEMIERTHIGLPNGYQLMTLAKKKLAAMNQMMETPVLRMNMSTTPRVLTKDEIIKGLQQVDDFFSPIKWVKFNSEDTKEGLARVTDAKTHKNQQFVIEGELYVPVVDESMARLGWTTEDPSVLTTISTLKLPNEASIKVVMSAMNLNTTDAGEWLAYETVLGAKRLYENKCDGTTCQARCHKSGCDSACNGDTCATGCVGMSCNAFCRGPGCMAMCIGDQCTAKCLKLSCLYIINGGTKHLGNATWDQLYPQYEMKGNPDVYAGTIQSKGQDRGTLQSRNNEYYDD